MPEAHPSDLSQLIPVNFSTQAHLPLFSLFIHVPPFWHEKLPPNKHPLTLEETNYKSRI
jgi:hypothetical protein